MLYVLLRLTDSDCLFGVFKLVLLYCQRRRPIYFKYSTRRTHSATKDPFPKVSDEQARESEQHRQNQILLEI